LLSLGNWYQQWFYPNRHVFPETDLDIAPFVCLQEKTKGSHFIISRSPFTYAEIRATGYLPIGGVTEKVEGFFDLCDARGKSSISAS